ncbi:Nrap protein [Periconia macrospinosa]|uniref:U3 small nucleolar RNA-associated protein 22 n=1 Tax=Periconia macrospinosa TaxID=97972 RepID=A0A2V1E8Y5_9PLEO|nr:Nrap protein [Periconia macrospinosa]
MAPPAIKRRKLSHDGESESERSFASDETDGASMDETSSVEGSNEEDISMDESGESEQGEGTSGGNDDDEDSGGKVTGSSSITTKKLTAMGKSDNAKKTERKPDVSLQDGGYTAETFKSNVFKLQVDELLDQVKLNYGKKEAPAENAMRTLKTLIEQLPNRAPLSIAEAEKTLKSEGVTIPFPRPLPPKDARYTLQYERPSTVNATGSYPLKTATRDDHGFAIDLLVTMPGTIFQDKDYLNYRYFYKRAYYLACLAAGIKKNKESDFKISFDCLSGNQLQPIIVVESNSRNSATDFSGSNCRINILLNVSEDTFARSKLLPKSNCIRPRESEGDSANQTLPPTPFYNSTLQADTTVTAYLKLLHATAGRCDAFRDSCILGRIWMKQRGFGSRLRQGGFGNFEWAAITALLLEPNPGSGTPTLSTGYSSYQLFKATLQFLARHNLCKKPFAIRADDVAFPKSGMAPIFFDGARGLNVLYKMTPWAWSRLQVEAKLTVEMLSDSLFDQFDSTFILRTNLSRYRYDATLELPFSVFELDPKNDKYDRNIDESCNRLYSTLIRALTDRVSAVTFTLPDSHGWSIDSSTTAESQQKCILINFATDPANAYRTVDYGPAAENKQEAVSFRKFWGDKAELRRFKDGSILESVVWSTKEASTSVLEQIVTYILGRHLGPQVSREAKFVVDSFAPIVPAGRIQGQSGILPFTPIMNAFTVLEKDIRGFEGLPLQVRHIRAADPLLRYASVQPTHPAPASIILQFEASARWPDDLCAIQRTKVAFLLKLSQLLSATEDDRYSVKVGLEHPSQPSQNQAFLDITFRSEFTFRLRIHHDREATLLERQLKDKSLDAHSRESAAIALGLYNREFIQVVSHTQAVQNLCTRYPALSPSMRLTKRWFASHLLSPHFTPEFIELLVIRTFLQPHPWPVPSSATTGFLRTLSWLARWDWRHVPLIVDFSSSAPSSASDQTGASNNGKMKPDDLEKIQTRFEAWRRIDPAMNRVVLFAATNTDTDGNTWTDRAKPEKVVATRMTALAKAATAAIRAEEDATLQSLNGGEEKKTTPLAPESLFVSPTQDFDFVIHIASKYTRAASKKSKSDVVFKNIEHQQGKRSNSLKVEQELPAFFIEDLQNIYGDAVLFFYDPENYDRVAGLWNPLVTGERGFKVKPGWNSLPIKSKQASKKDKKKEEGKEEKEVNIRVNKAAVLNEIKRLGGDMVGRIEVNRM